MVTLFLQSGTPCWILRAVRVRARNVSYLAPITNEPVFLHDVCRVVGRSQTSSPTGKPVPHGKSTRLSIKLRIGGWLLRVCLAAIGFLHLCLLALEVLPFLNACILCSSSLSPSPFLLFLVLCSPFHALFPCLSSNSFSRHIIFNEQYRVTLI
jgi:hypothetical protein